MFKNFTKVLTLAVVVAMMLSMTACTWPWGKNPGPEKCTSHVDANGDRVCDNEGCGMKLDYTYNTYTSTFGTSWNPHTYQTANDSTVLDYTTVGFYTFDYNETKDGFVVVPEMAAAMPLDVTTEYVGEEWDITEEDTSRAWLIELRDDLAWEDGTPITAHDFVASADRLLDPVAINYRADQLYSGDLAIMNAKSRFYSGRDMLEDNFDGAGSFYQTMDTFVKGEDGVYTMANGKNIVIALTSPLSWLGGRTLDFYVNYYCYNMPVYELDADGNPVIGEDGKPVVKTTPKLDADGNPVVDEEGNVVTEIVYEVDENGNKVVYNDMFDLAAYKQLKALADADGYVKITDESVALLTSVITYSADWGESPVHVHCYLYYTHTYPITEFDQVGIKAISDTELVIILESPLDGFYLDYSLTGNFGLVKTDIYDACASVDANGVYTNTYGTSKETYMGFGPYKLETFQLDKQLVFTRNDNWYGYSDPAREGQYQTTKVVIDKYENDDTAFTAFLQGKLDAKGLDVDHIADYTSSSRIYYTDGASTWFIAMNPNEEAFAEWEANNPGKDKSILGMKEFRMAISFSLNRQDFINALDPMGSIGLALFNNMICSDPENGTMYRTEEAAKDTILEFWGISQDDIGAGKLYPTKDEAIASITGYNLEGAKELFNQAYDKAVAEGLYNGTDTIEICIGTPNATSKFYSNGYNFLVDNYTEAVKGTKLEGKLTFTNDNTLGNGFANALRANTVDMLFGVGWTGSALNPYGLIGAYTQPSYQYDPAWITSTAIMEFVIDGVTYKASVLDWTSAIEGDPVVIENVATGETKEYSCGTAEVKKAPERQAERILLLAALERAVLNNYDMIPTHNESSASLLGYQVEYGTQEYVYGVGRGGIQYMTYNYTDAEWDEYVKSEGGVLKYN